MSQNLGFGMAIGLTDNFSRAANTVIGQFNRLDQASSGLANNVSKSFKRLQSGMVITGAGAAMLAPLGMAVQKSMAFNKSVSEVGAISRASAEDMVLLKEASMTLGETTAFTAKEASEGQKFLAMAGFSVKDTLAAMPAVLDLASASNTGLARTSDIVSDTLSAMGMEATQTAKLTSQMAYVATTANTSIDQLGEALKYTTATASALNVSSGELMASLGMLGDIGLKGSVAGTTMENFLSRMGKIKSGKAGKELAKLGLSLDDLTDKEGNLLKLKELMPKVMGALSQIDGNVRRQQVAQDWFGKIGGKAVNAFNQTEGEAGLKKVYGKYAQQVTDVGEDYTKQMSARMLDNLAGSVTRFQSASEGLMIRIGDLLEPTIKKGVDFLTGFTAKITEFVKSPMGGFFVKVASGVGILTTALGIGVTAFHGYRIAVLTTTPFLQAFKASAMNAVGGVRNLGVQMLRMAGMSKIAGAGFMASVAPFAAVIVPIVAVGAAIYGLYKSWQSFDNLLKTGDSYGDSMIFQFAEGGFALRLQQVGGVIRGIWEIITSANSQGFSMPNNIYQALQGLGVADFVLNIGTYITRFHGFVEGIGQGASELLSVFSPLGKVFSDLWDSIRNSLGVVGGAFGKAKTPMQSFIDAGKNMVLFFKPAFEMIAQVVAGVVNGIIWLNDTFNIVGNTINFFKGIIGGVGQIVITAFSGIYQIISPLFSAFSNLGKAFSDALKSINFGLKNTGDSMLNFSAIGKLIGDVVQASIQGIVWVVTGLIEGFVWLNTQTGIVSGAMQLLVDAGMRIIDTLAFLGRTAMTLGETFVNIFGVIGAEISNFRNGMTSLPQMFYNIGVGMVSNLWNGFKSIFKDFVSYVAQSFMKIPGAQMVMDKLGIDFSQFSGAGMTEAQTQKTFGGQGFRVPDNQALTGTGNVQLPDNVQPTDPSQTAQSMLIRNEVQNITQNQQPVNNNINVAPTPVQTTVYLDSEAIVTAVNDRNAIDQARQ